MFVILPFNKDPIIKSLSHHYFYFGILSGNNIDIDKFLFNNFISICFIKIEQFFEFPGVFSLFRLFNREKFPSNIQDPIEFIKMNIDLGKYVQIYLNQAYISTLGLSFDFIHDFLIYGYNEENKEFNITGYIKDKQINALVLKDFRITYAELIDSYKNAENNPFPILSSNFIISIKKIPEQKIKKWKIIFNIFCFLYVPLPSFGLFFLNSRALKKIASLISQSINNNNRIFDPRFLKTLQGHAQIISKLEEALLMSDIEFEKCKKLNDLISNSLVYATVNNAKRNRMDQYYSIHLKVLLENIEKIKRLYLEILKDIINKLIRT